MNQSACLFLLNNGADPNLESKQGETPLSLAVKNNLSKVVEVLCIRGADFNQPDSRLADYH